jgi:hypothetical protein
VRRHGLGVLKSASCLKLGRDARGAKGAAADFVRDRHGHSENPSRRIIYVFYRGTKALHWCSRSALDEALIGAGSLKI